MKNEPIAFELGFVARAAFRNNAKGRERIGEPAWSTVQWLDFKDTTYSARAREVLLSEPIRKWLRTAWNVRMFDAMAIAEGKFEVQLRELGLVAGMDEGELTGKFFEYNPTNFKTLERVILQPATYGARSDGTFLTRIIESALAYSLHELVFRADIAIWSEATCRALGERLGAATPKGAGPRRVSFSTRAGRITLGCHDEGRSTIDVTLVAGNGEALAKQITALHHARIKQIRISGHTHSEADMLVIRAATAPLGVELDVRPPVQV
jgi:hypothetical protein